MQLRNSFFLFLFLLSGISRSFSQVYSPVPVTGFNGDVFAEAFPSTLATTSMSLDLTNHIMYTASFAVAAGLGAGVVNSGTIVTGTKTYQLAPYNGPNILNIPVGVTHTLNVTTPASYELISLLSFSTEGNCNVNIQGHYTDGTTTNYGNFALQDWFNGVGAVYCCFGRCIRVATGPYNPDGLPNNPMFYKIDITPPCADRSKLLQSIDINTLNGTTAATSSNFLALSGATTLAHPVVSASPSTICPGSSSTLSATNLSTYAWSPGGQVTASVTVSPASSATYTVVGTNSNGCPDSGTVTVTVSNAPLAITINPSPASVCPGAALTLTASGASTYAWSPTTGLSASTGAAVTVTTFSTTTYSVTGTAVGGCTGSDTVVVTVATAPTVTIAPAAPTICSGASVTLTASGASTYSWSPTTGLNVATGATVTATPAATNTFTITGVGVNGCVGQSNVTVTISPTPVVTITPSSATICIGDATTLTGNGATTYAWSPPAGLSATTGTSVTASPVVTTTYSITGSIGLCTADAIVQVTAVPAPVISVSSSNSSICNGAPVTFTATGGSNYTWSPGATTGSTLTVNPSTTTIYTITNTDAAGLCANSDTISVAVYPQPVASFLPASLIACESLKVSFTNQSTNSTIWHWTFSDTTSSNFQNPTHTFHTGIWDAKLVVSNAFGCTDSSVQPGLIKVYPNPVAAFSVSPEVNIPIGLSTAHFDFTNHSLGGTNYLWSFGDGNGSEDSSTSHTYTAVGMYTVKLIVTSSEGCTDTLSEGLIDITSDGSVYVPNAFTPNGDGSNDVFMLQGYGLANVLLRVFDRWGMMIFESHDINHSWDGTINGNKAPDGVYIYTGNVTFYDGTSEDLVGYLSLLR